MDSSVERSSKAPINLILVGQVATFAQVFFAIRAGILAVRMVPADKSMRCLLLTSFLWETDDFKGING